MTDQSTANKSSHGLFGSVTPMVKMIVLVVTIIGAIPTAITAYYAWDLKVPFKEVPHRLAQYEILERNLNCMTQIEYRVLSTTEGTQVDVGACPTTRDISLRVSAPDGKAAYEWIAYNQLRKPGDTPPSGILDLFLGIAHAEGNGTQTRLAQAPLEIVCQSLVGKQELVRIVKEGAKCFRETMSPFRGTVDKREDVPCNTQCPAKS
jgi:hypothetical protein